MRDPIPPDNTPMPPYDNNPTPRNDPPTSWNDSPAPVADEKEEVFYDSRVPIKAALGRHGLLYVLLLGWNIGLLIAWFQARMSLVRLTSQRVVIIKGLLSQREEDIPLYRGKDINFSQTIAGRLFGTGVITLFSDDATAPYISFAVPRPREYKEKLRESMNRERIRFRSRSLD